MNVDTTIMDTTPFNPYSTWQPGTYGPFLTEFSGETKYLGTDMPTSNFSTMQVQQFNDAFTNTLPTEYDICPWPSRYVKSAISGNSFGIQTSGTSNAFNC